MVVCPVCKNIMDNEETVCKECGYDESLDYEKHPTFCVTKQNTTKSKLKKEYKLLIKQRKEDEEKKIKQSSVYKDITKQLDKLEKENKELNTKLEVLQEYVKQELAQLKNTITAIKKEKANTTPVNTVNKSKTTTTTTQEHNKTITNKKNNTYQYKVRDYDAYMELLKIEYALNGYKPLTTNQIEEFIRKNKLDIDRGINSTDVSKDLATIYNPE